MINYKQQLEKAIAQLKKHGAKFGGDTIEIEAPMIEDIAFLIKTTNENSPILKGDIFEFYKTINSVKIHWFLRDKEMEGGLGILPSVVSELRSPAEDGGQPLEGVLYCGEEEEADLKLLKQMYVFDSVPGRSDFITYIPKGEEIKLYLVEESKIIALKTNFIETIDMLTKYAGCWGLRKHLTHKDWKTRIANDKTIQSIFS